MFISAGYGKTKSFAIGDKRELHIIYIMGGSFNMKKPTKIIIGVCTVIVGLIMLSIIIFTLWWNGAFNKLFVKDITAYESPNGTHSLIFQQLGEPEWPFGQTEVRLTLKNQNNKKLNSIDTAIQDDGGNAHEGNIKSIEWTNDSVIVILQASEMDDKEIVITYKK